MILYLLDKAYLFYISPRTGFPSVVSLRLAASGLAVQANRRNTTLLGEYAAILTESFRALINFAV